MSTSSEYPIVTPPADGDGERKGGDGEAEEDRVECEFANGGKCLLEELIQRQEDLEHSHQVLCKLIKKMYNKLEVLDEKLNKIIAGEFLLGG